MVYLKMKNGANNKSESFTFYSILNPINSHVYKRDVTRTLFYSNWNHDGKSFLVSRITDKMLLITNKIDFCSKKLSCSGFCYVLYKAVLCFRISYQNQYIIFFCGQYSNKISIKTNSIYTLAKML